MHLIDFSVVAIAVIAVVLLIILMVLVFIMSQTFAHIAVVATELIVFFISLCLLWIIVEDASEVAADAEDEDGIDGDGHPNFVLNVVLAIIPIPWASLVDVIAESVNILRQVLSGDINDHVDKEKDEWGQIGQEERVPDSMAITLDKGEEEHDQDNAGKGNSNEVHSVDGANQCQDLERGDDKHTT